MHSLDLRLPLPKKEMTRETAFTGHLREAYFFLPYIVI